MLDGIFVMEEGGTCLASVANTEKSPKGMDQTDENLVTPFLSALDIFANHSFKGRIKCLIIDDDEGNEKKVYLKNFKINQKDFKVVAIIGNDDMAYKDIDSRLMRVKWALQEKGVQQYVGSRILPPSVRTELERRIEQVFTQA